MCHRYHTSSPWQPGPLETSLNAAHSSRFKRWPVENEGVIKSMICLLKIYPCKKTSERGGIESLISSWQSVRGAAAYLQRETQRRLPRSPEYLTE